MIHTYLHCAICTESKPDGMSPAQYQRIQVGWTVEGLQVVCLRHGVNMMHIHFEGQKHPADLRPFPVETAEIDIPEDMV